MNAIREQSRNPIVIGIVAFIIGAIFGLVVLGWWLWPVEWENATPEHMSLDYQVEYLRMAIEAYGQNGDVANAQERYAALGEGGAAALSEIENNPQDLRSELIQDFSDTVQATPLAEEEPESKPSLTSALTWLIPLLCVLFLVLIAVVFYLFVLRGRLSSRGSELTPVMQAEQAKQQVEYTDYAATGTEPPIAQFMASYKIGDDLFDDSFSIDSASGEFLGECGVGISETVGVGDPKKVSAFEVWLFDKNDIQTVTKVMMAANAFYDDPTRQRLEAKGEPVLAEPGIETVLETQTLQLVARVVDMNYGEGAMPDQSFFDHLILELSVWSK